MKGRRNKTDQVVSVAKVYRDYNAEQGKAYSDYENYQIDWAESEHYCIVKKLGRGKYSEVFEGYDVKENQKVVIKILKPVRVSKIRREIKVLKTLAGGPNIVKLLDVCKPVSPAFGALIFEHIEHEPNIKKAMLSFTDYEVRFYMYQLAKALDYCHSRGIIHRDVKPGNVVIDKTSKKLRLIDWGLADFYHPKQFYNVRVASRHYKSPELLVKMQTYDYSVDLFAFGLTLLGIVLQKIPFFRGADNIDQLYKLAEVLGTIDLKKYISKYNLKPNKEFNRLLAKDTPRMELEGLHDSRKKTASNGVKFSELSKSGGLYDLLNSVLLYDHQLRLTAAECMKHSYFAQIREEEAQQQAVVQGPRGQTVDQKADDPTASATMDTSLRAAARDTTMNSGP